LKIDRYRCSALGVAISLPPSPSTLLLFSSRIPLSPTKVLAAGYLTGPNDLSWHDPGSTTWRWRSIAALCTTLFYVDYLLQGNAPLVFAEEQLVVRGSPYCRTGSGFPDQDYSRWPPLDSLEVVTCCENFIVLGLDSTNTLCATPLTYPSPGDDALYRVPAKRIVLA
jgi:hypothetical protein